MICWLRPDGVLEGIWRIARFDGEASPDGGGGVSLDGESCGDRSELISMVDRVDVAQLLGQLSRRWKVKRSSSQRRHGKAWPSLRHSKREKIAAERVKAVKDEQRLAMLLLLDDGLGLASERCKHVKLARAAKDRAGMELDFSLQPRQSDM